MPHIYAEYLRDHKSHSGILIDLYISPPSAVPEGDFIKALIDIFFSYRQFACVNVYPGLFIGPMRGHKNRFDTTPDRNASGVLLWVQ
ncbi:hypothetical protein EFV37_04250 [Mesorhizobium loti]|uniref:Uncharacterized protein n=1 Tax=Mesorhizobium jarvisii TaxID=1777867 RepID=A0A6M7T9B4_9HYPH|nr:hypothetical protein A9K72_33055 [Mesorhizobium loti]QKC61604.1 hypothetical protein EB229_04250 [Mesorhizobium jarvisii]QKD07513.1 hypothetical protein EFV37_04250 [Mesorhizobium loti]RJT28548.1 hypothetical protein D3242_31815 [Mesorhizobium jarvisii]